MPVVMNLPRPTVNYVGNTEMAPHSPALDPNGFERRTPKYVTLIAPDGTEEQVLKDNVRDFIRLKNYRKKLVELPPPVVGVEANAALNDSTSDVLLVGQSKMDEQKRHLDYLADLRRTLTEVEVEVDKRWGIARLRTEIERRKLVMPEMSETEDV